MKMDPFIKQSSSRTNSNSSSRENVLSGIYESAHFANIMVEFENGNREMAVDVPDSFIAQTKTPPKYPPPPPSSKFAMSSNHMNGSYLSSPPPPTVPRDHLKIERDGRLVNTLDAPQVPSRGSIAEEFHPTPSESERIKKWRDDLRKRNIETGKKNQEMEFLRNSIRNSNKMRALKQEAPSNGGFMNKAFQKETTDINEIRDCVRRLRSSSVGNLAEMNVALAGVADLLDGKDFQEALRVQEMIQAIVENNLYTPDSCDAQDLAEDSMKIAHQFSEEDGLELSKILRNEHIEGLLYAHDKVAERHLILKSLTEEDALLDRLSHYSEPNIKIVKIEKTNDPLGATVRNEDGAIVVGRVIHGGAAERSGLLHEGDEILEVNEVELRGKTVNDVCDVLYNMHGTLTFLIVPTRQPVSPGDSGVMFVKAHFNYDPEDDPYVPCRELGISFVKGDILRVIDQRDPHWWQALRDGEEDQALPGLIPSASFQQQREAMKLTIAQDADRLTAKNKAGGGADNSNPTGFLCAKKSGRKKRKKMPYSPDVADELDSEDVLTYEEVVLYYPKATHKRPVVLIGPPNIGRHELRQTLMQDSNRFAAAVPHTSRTKRPDELDGQDYHFISRLQFEQDILARRFVEHGEYEKSYYGTSLEAIRSVVSSGKICVLNLHPQSLKILKSSDLKPFVVFVAPPSLEKLRKWKMEQTDLSSKHPESVNDRDLQDIIERAREMEEQYGHFFDMIIIYSDPERAYQQLLNEINLLEREPQWVPAEWQKFS